MAIKPLLERVAFSPREFAELFGKSQTWGYRQIYAGKVKAITQHGRMLIPAAEVEAILKTAGIYDGLKPSFASAKSEVQRLAPHLKNAWQTFLSARRQAKPSMKMTSTASAVKKPPSPARQAALARLLSGRKRG